MTDAIGATALGMTTPLAASSSTATTGASDPTSAMGSDTFLKLLVAQLKYQDPSKPTDGTQFLAQTAQFQMVEKLQQLSDQNTQLLSEQQTLSAVGLVGRTVSYTDNGQNATGVVGSVKLTAGGPMLTVGATQVPLHSVTEVRSAG